MAAHVRQINEARRRLRVPRRFRDRSNPLEELDANEVFERYRFHPQSIVILVGLIGTAHNTFSNTPLPPILQVLVCLRFLASGAIHLHVLIGDSLNISRSTAGRCIRTVSRAIGQGAKRFINFPVGQRAEDAKREFGSIAGFPNVVGCIDGTFVRLQRPSHNEADFVNRKGYHSLNVQVCCDASWPGSVHDSRIFKTSGLCRSFENAHYTGFILGDSGYPSRWFFMTQVLNPTCRAAERYNGALCRTRVLIEQTFGILKRRFQCLRNELKTSPEQAVVYVLACVVLHNFGIDHGDILINDDDDNDIDNQNTDTFVPQGLGHDGTDIRRHMINNFFNK